MTVNEMVRDAVLAGTGLPIPGPDGYVEVPAASERLQNLVELARTVCGQPVTAINIITEDLQYQAATAGMEPYLCTREDSMCAVGFLSGEQLRGLETLAAQIVDVLQLEHRARRLADALAEAERSNTLLAEFAGRISHDLRNPLTSILGFVELGEMDAEAGDDARLPEYLGIVGRTGRRMLAMVEDVLAFATIGGDLQPAAVSLAELVGDVIADLATAVEESGASVDSGELL